MMSKKYSMKELEQLMAVCTSTFFNLNGSLPDAEELCREIGNEYRSNIYNLLGASVNSAEVVGL
jgi:hypothetical protein